MAPTRFIINYSLSVSDKTEASQLIKEHEEFEYIKSYKSISLLKKATLLILSFAALFNFILLIGLIFLSNGTSSFLERGKNFSIIIISLLFLALITYKSFCLLLEKTMKKNLQSEIEDVAAQEKLKVNEFYIEHINNISRTKLYWSHIKNNYRKEGFIFIQTMTNRCIVIPERCFSSEIEISDFHAFIKKQISKHVDCR